MIEIDIHNFKVICQTCGKTGMTDFNKPQRETGWMLRYSHKKPGDSIEGFEYWQCINCFDEENNEKNRMDREG